jgi:hypothetical protein
MARRPCTCTATVECPACQAWTTRQQARDREATAWRDRVRLPPEPAPVRQTCRSHPQYVAGCRLCTQARAAYQRHYYATLGGRRWA